MIKKERIEAVKHGVDLVALIRSRGIELTKKGKGFVGLCPFHAEATPSFSVNPHENLWQCFGCNTGGDAIRFVELFDKVSFPEAVEKLSTGSIPTKPAPSAPLADKQPPPGLTVKEQKLLARVVSYYQHTLTLDKRGLNYLKNERGISDSRSLTDFGCGYVNGTLLEILPQDDEIKKTLQRIGILNKKGHETFYNCVVFPLHDQSGAIVNLYARSIDAEAGVTHLYLPGPRSGLVNRQAVKRSQSVLLTESIIDALTLYDQGFKNVIPIYGVNGLLDDHLSLFNRRIKEAYLVFDADEAGRNGALAVSERLKGKEITCHVVELPAKDVNVYFTRHTPEEFEKLLHETNPHSLEQSDKVKKRAQSLYQETEHGFIVGYGERFYEIKGIQRTDTQLKVTAKASKAIDGTMPFELTTIDLYSSRSRTWFAKSCAEIFTASDELVKEDIGRLLILVENWKPKQKTQAKAEATQEEREEALRFLRNPAIFEEILTDLETVGITGEETNKLTGYLAAVSRKLEDPLSVLIQSRSAAGKSTLQDAILSLVPEEDFVKYTRITDQALFYKEEDALVHKIIAIEEDQGMGGAAYSIRNIQSSKKITVAATGKDPATGKMKTEEYTVKGPVAVMITTTAAELEGETASRFLFLTIDESAKMTAAIHKKQREADTLEGLVKRTKADTVRKKHHTAQRMLKPLAVVNPFTPYLSYPDGSLRTRRDHKKYLGLIRTIAFLFQYQRETKKVAVEGKEVEYIEVTLDDIDKANQLAHLVLGQCLDELAPPSRTLLTLIYNMVKTETAKSKEPLDQFLFNRRQIREATNWTDWQIKAHVKQLEEMEYLHVRMGAQGKQYSYALNYKGEGGESGKCYLNLTPVAEIKRLADLEGTTGTL
jgi:DNA primase